MAIDFDYIYRRNNIPKRHRNKLELSLFSFDAYELLKQCKEKIPLIDNYDISFIINRQPTLACIEIQNSSAIIKMHSLLNHQQTPLEIIRLIFIHECLNLLVWPREIGGKVISHPPEFWEKEEQYIPDRHICW